MLNVRQLAEEGQLDERIAEMVETLILVAEFETDVAKTGRKAALSKQWFMRLHTLSCLRAIDVQCTEWNVQNAFLKNAWTFP